MAASFIYFVILAVNYLVMYFLKFDRKANVILGIVSILGLLTGIYVWIDVNLIIGSSIVFMSIIILSLNASLLYYLSHGGDYDSWRIVKLSSMLMFGGIFLAVIIAITEGDIIEIFDSSETNNKKKSATKL
jgi:Na+/melibiose symporter-like transporter